MLLVIALVGASTISQAQNKQIQYSATGIGAQADSCNIWIKARKDKDSDEGFITHFGMMSWLQGNFAGRNVNKDVTMPSAAMLDEVLDQYCATEPTYVVSDIAASFWPFLVKKQGKSLTLNAPK